MLSSSGSVPIVFLDFDGVVIIPAGASGPNKQDPWSALSTYCLANVDRLCEQLGGAQIVISSMWRYNYSLSANKDGLRRYGLTAQVIDQTPCSLWGEIPAAFPHKTRGDEIAYWLHLHDVPASKCIILEDAEPLGPMEHRCVRTNSTRGFDDRRLAAALLLPIG